MPAVCELLEPRLLLSAGPIEFTEVTAQMGLVTPLLGMQGHAGAWGDVNGDGWVDLYFGTFAGSSAAEYNVRGNTDGASPNRLLINQGGTGFVESVQPALNFYASTSGAVFADFDNDGDLDLLVITNCRATTNPITSVQNKIFENDGLGNFTDRTAGSNIDFEIGYTGRNPFVLDYDNDGLLDVLIQEDTWFSPSGSRLMRNTGNFVFQNVTVAAGLPTNLLGLGGAVGDVNNDGYVDLVFVGATYNSKLTPKYTIENRIFLNNGNGTFRDANLSVLNTGWIQPAGDNTPTGASLGDLDNDGDLDLVIGHHYQSTYKGLVRMGPRVYMNLGNDASGTPIFQDITDASGMTQIYIKQPHIAIQDFDNDGRMDILTSATMEVDGVAKPYLFHNVGVVDGIPRVLPPDGTDPTTYNGYNPADADTPDPRYFPGAPVIDFDNDGRLDVFGVEWWPTHASPLFRNTGSYGNYIQIQVRTDEGANRFGVGARVEIYQPGFAGQAAYRLGIADIAIGDGYSSGTPAMVHFGTPGYSTVDIIVRMPSGGPVYTQSGVTTNQLVTVPIVDAVAPTVQAQQVNDGSADRSDIRTLALTFSEDVTLTAAALRLYDHAAETYVTAPEAGFSYDSATATAVWNLASLDLSDGYHTAELVAGGVFDLAGNPLASYELLMHKLPGDANGDRAVDVADLGILGANYGASGSWWMLGADFNADGAVDVADLGILGANYGRILAAPSALTMRENVLAAGTSATSDGDEAGTAAESTVQGPVLLSAADDASPAGGQEGSAEMASSDLLSAGETGDVSESDDYTVARTVIFTPPDTDEETTDLLALLAVREA